MSKQDRNQEDGKLKLHDAEYRFACIVWESEPIGSGHLSRLCQERLGWKRTTTYTVLKKLCDRGFLKNENSLVTSLIKKEEVQRYESRALLEKSFGGSLPGFIASFLGDKKLSEGEAQELNCLLYTSRCV